MKSLQTYITESLIQINEAINDKDWQRMIDLRVVDKKGEGIARAIKDKNKAINRFVAGLIVSNEKPEYKYGDYFNEFGAFGKRALELGATQEEIQKVFDETKIPEKWETKLSELLSKNLDNWITGPLMRRVLKAGYDISQIGKGGRSTTELGKDAMRRNGIKWTIGYSYEIKTKSGNLILNFDAITSEAVNNNTIQFVFERNGSSKIFIEKMNDWKKYNVTTFFDLIIQSCKAFEEQNQE